MSEADFEKLGVFYLGKLYDSQKKSITKDLCLYDSKDLVTHGVCIGMTGSGKTGLCIGLLEEAAIDGIPVIAIDPKGDIANILLQFPQLRGSDFEPWVDPDQARRTGLELAEFARQQAEQWRKGLEEWDQSGQRIQRLKESADFAIYTPGSNSGIPVSVVNSFAAPPQSVLDDADALREKIGATASSLLALLGIEADPLKSREHILFSNILKSAWLEKRDLSIQAIIQSVQKPPFAQIGALDIDSFYPAKERFELAMAINNLLASPGFEAWMDGEGLDIDRMLYTAEGKPRVSILSIAHLSDSERMFFVTLLLNQMVAWMRSQSGTTSLRAILYMDEIFGYFPPVANPPSKTPLLTLMKQGRAFGLGVLLASQNPVDLDYKGLANAGTWFIGRLQTERDKMRVLDGLEGAAAGSSNFDRQSLDRLLSGLGSRVFLLNNVHENQPTTFMSRWTLSYLRGPVTRDQIKRLTLARRTAGSSSSKTAEPQDAASKVSDSSNATRSGSNSLAGQQSSVSAPNAELSRPVLQPGISEVFLPIRQAAPDSSRLFYRAMLLGFGNVRFVEAKYAVDSTLQYAVLLPVSADSAQAVDWSKSQPAKVWIEDLVKEPETSGRFEPLAAGMSNAKSYTAWTKEFTTWLYNSKKVSLWKSEVTGEFSKPRESERDFRIRLSQSAREHRDEAAETLKAKYAPKLASLQERLRRAEQALEREQMQAHEQQMQSAISVGATVLGAFMGRKTISRTTINRAGGTARTVGRTIKEQQDVEHATETVQAVSDQLNNLNQQFASEMTTLEGKFDPLQVPLKEVVVTPKKTNIAVPLLALAWAPYFRAPDGREVPAWIRNPS
jgi:hypothetical protein